MRVTAKQSLRISKMNWYKTVLNNRNENVFSLYPKTREREGKSRFEYGFFGHTIL